MESTEGSAASICEKLKHINLDLDDYTSNNGEIEQFCDRCRDVRSNELGTENGIVSCCYNCNGPCAGKENGSCCCTPNGLPSPLCVYYSPRIMGLLKGEKTEYDTAKDHWTALDPESEAEAEMIAEENRKYFDEVLAKHPEWGGFFTRIEHLELGEKIGEGAQAEIFAASSTVGMGTELVAKVWKEGVSLKQLERQWPPLLMKKLSQQSEEWPFKNIYGGVFLREGKFKNRFAFVMERYEYDLRTYIDRQMLEMLEKKSHGPPFKDIHDVYEVLWTVAYDLAQLHKAGVVHRDIKASNVLRGDGFHVRLGATFVIDYECSVGVVGTGFWRAPEILERLQKRVRSCDMVFTKEADIYSFGMMCYELVTGCIPFEGHPQNDYSIVLRGERPPLQDDLSAELRSIIVECWHQDPLSRPSASTLEKKFQTLYFQYVFE
ncbi:hypothetical protein KC19_12G076000 [Ceratodon purpureus]|uniref:Protein kinase domain-containing protein n=1 Tax=Ceratodon purpureus TaxID=3225 RepID=A0A8T0GAD4_CERPU|nr:hypothetical protein KC19_12G076000 [Ceratodon purpureus]